jgi:hypothetical protein
MQIQNYEVFKMGNFTTAAKNEMLDAITVDRLSLHDDDPGADGTANELTGGSPAYARKSCVFDAAASGERLLNASVTFDVPAAGTVAYVGNWDYNGGTMVFKGADAVTSEVFAGQGQYIVTATTSKLTISDPPA